MLKKIDDELEDCKICGTLAVKVEKSNVILYVL